MLRNKDKIFRCLIQGSPTVPLLLNIIVDLSLTVPGTVVHILFIAARGICNYIVTLHPIKRHCDLCCLEKLLYFRTLYNLL